MGYGRKGNRRGEEIAALRLGLDLGMTLIDTAEMYGDGGAEEVVGEAIAGRRTEVFLVSKVLPHHATRRGTIAACHASLKRLRTDQLDLYLLHWRGDVPLAETLDAFRGADPFRRHPLLGRQQLRRERHGRDRRARRRHGGATDQVLYNLARRGIEFDLLPWCRERRIPVMAYSPIDQGRLLTHPLVARIARRRGATPAQVALAWVLRQRTFLPSRKAPIPITCARIEGRWTSI